MYTQMTVPICHSRVTSAGKLTVNACVNVTEHVHNNKDISKNLSELMTGEWWIMQKKINITTSAHLTAKNFVVPLCETFKISVIILGDLSHSNCQSLASLLTTSRGDWFFIFLLLFYWMIEEQTKTDSYCKDNKN